MKETTNVESGYLCHCLQITEARFAEILDREDDPNFALLQAKYGIGSVCSSCQYEVKGKLEEHNVLRRSHPRPRGLLQRLRWAAGDLLRWLTTSRQPVPPPGPVDYQVGLFFLRHSGLESRLVISNLRFPEHERNVNGDRVTFRATLHGAEGTQLGVSDRLSLASGETAEYSLQTLLPAVTGDFIGGLYVRFEGLQATSSLRPYGLLTSTTPEFRARCHYHDKYATFVGPGYFFNTSPCEPGQTAWVAIANCQSKPYETEVHLKLGEHHFTGQLSLLPMGAAWHRLEDLFPALADSSAPRSPGVFWMSNPQHVMVYYMWYNQQPHTWTMQHH